MKQINYKKLILPNIPYVFFVYLFDKVGQAVRLAPGADISAKILNITQGFSAAFENALPSVYPLDLLVGIVGAVIIRLIVYVKGKNAKKYRKGAEYGSARWGNAEDIKPYLPCCCGYNPYAFIAHTVQQRVKLPPPGGFLRIAVREEKLIYRNMIPGYKVIEYL